MTPSKPYLMRALYEWIVDNECTPYMLVDTTNPGVRVPDGFADEGQMVLNLSPAATRHLIMNNEIVSFEARFSGMPHQLLRSEEHTSELQSRPHLVCRLLL